MTDPIGGSGASNAAFMSDAEARRCYGTELPAGVITPKGFAAGAAREAAHFIGQGQEPAEAVRSGVTSMSEAMSAIFGLSPAVLPGDIAGRVVQAMFSQRTIDFGTARALRRVFPVEQEPAHSPAPAPKNGWQRFLDLIGW